MIFGIVFLGQIVSGMVWVTIPADKAGVMVLDIQYPNLSARYSLGFCYNESFATTQAINFQYDTGSDLFDEVLELARVSGYNLSDLHNLLNVTDNTEERQLYAKSVLELIDSAYAEADGVLEKRTIMNLDFANPSNYV
ncbi:hypothetical protein WICPIJ_008124 [Wickerhamomyces pijperi]|uniref:Uncharacterized protein n=1 Tax=Wickerhamomyces pijperi TaxID=599730 RepID=A0A9P8Q024_WICPI|nr:hypothetical protein WICPIJ_008124 [Wickerhamomyces pijperi]